MMMLYKNIKSVENDIKNFNF